ncbi:hypothetical protein BDV93DRAFT_517540 [Ceratobasidium sp. AG-I]|nr:hypothetical protein BDV93DRAFT_517540 [Ceratobasidium sp. AG-I]
MYVLKFQSSDQLHFFWLQDPDNSQDANVVRRINELIAETNLETPSINEGEVAGVAVAGGGTANQTSGATPAGPLNPEQLNSFMQELMRGLQGNRAGVAPDFSLTDILTPAVLTTILQDPQVVESSAPFLPTDLLSPSSPVADMSRQEMLGQTVASAPFRASVRSLDQALSTGLLGGLVANLGMPVEAGLGVHPFLEAIKVQAAERNQAEQGNSDDHQMDTQ